MFVTHGPFKHTMQLEGSSTLWTSIEIALHWPWYIATVQGPNEPVRRTFALGTNDDLLLFAQQAPMGPLVALQLVLPPDDKRANAWQLIPIVAVERYSEAVGVSPLAVVTSTDGTTYGGVPLARMNAPKDGLTSLVRFPVPEASGLARGRRFAMNG
jgi:hypothetical protein